MTEPLKPATLKKKRASPSKYIDPIASPYSEGELIRFTALDTEIYDALVDVPHCVPSRFSPDKIWFGRLLPNASELRIYILKTRGYDISTGRISSALHRLHIRGIIKIKPHRSFYRANMIRELER